MIGAVVFDVYKTLLEVLPPPADVDGRWKHLWQTTFRIDPPRGLEAFATAVARRIEEEHAAARRSGIPHPEIFWPELACAVERRLSELDSLALDHFLFEHASLQRTVRLASGAERVLQFLREKGIPIGIASNAQPYTLRELQSALASHGLDRGVFAQDVCFWSFEAGFSKPDPHVFRWLSARLRLRGIAQRNALMVGDRLDNDVVPASAQGWQTWHLVSGVSEAAPGGPWEALEKRLRALL